MKLYRINALLLKYYFITINRVDRLFDIFYWPLIDIFIWGFTSAFIKQISEFNIISMALGGIILWMFVWRASQDIAVFVLEDFWSKNLYNLFTTPVRISEHIISIVIFGFFRAVASFIVMASLAYILYSFNIFSINILFIAVSVLLLLSFGWSMGILITSLIFLYGQRIQVLAWSIVWVIQPFSCVFYPLNSLPAWAVPIAKIMPTTYVFENLRSLLYNQSINYTALLYAFVANIVFLLISSLVLKFSFEIARKSGQLAKPD